MFYLLSALNNRIRIIKSVSTWEEAVNIGGLLLLNDGIITPQYINKMIEVSKQLGPYVVVAPGIAIPHARPEDGANKFGVSLLVVKNGVNFNSHNDPVFLVLSFATPDKTSHLRFLSELAIILQNSTEIASIIKNFDTSKEIVDYLTSILNVDKGEN
ncbi:MAG: PTS sugar transporter subunit IIA [Nitrososphaeria archaeon]|jgi:PTS system ascorbate-specific IIA component